MFWDDEKGVAREVDIDTAIQAWRAASGLAKKFEALRKEFVRGFTALLVDPETGNQVEEGLIPDGRSATFYPQNGKRDVDLDTFEREAPEFYGRCEKETQYRVFGVTIGANNTR